MLDSWILGEMETTEKELINFTVYVKKHIINESNDYRTEYDFVHSNLSRSYIGSFKDYFDSHGILTHFDIDKNKPYTICVDVNGNHSIHDQCGMVSILLDDRIMLNVNHMPYHTTKPARYIQIVPDEERWFKHITLDDTQIEAAKKIIDEVEKETFTRPTKKRRCDDK